MTNNETYHVATADDMHLTYDTLREATNAAMKVGAAGFDVTVYGPEGSAALHLEGSQPTIAAALRLRIGEMEAQS